MSLIGYARVSTARQDHKLQLDALKEAGCKKVFVDTASGAEADRPELAKLLAFLREGDVVVVWKLDRLARSLKQLVELVSGFGERGIGLKVLTGAPIDTTTPAGKLVFAIFAGLAEFERELIRERVNAGLVAAREEGRIGGRPKLEDARVHELRGRLARRQSWRTIAREMGISQATISRYAKHEPGEAQASGAK